MRGKQNFFQFQLYLHRITPACAGKTVPFVKQRKCKEDHPRVCGENDGGWRASDYEEGSPPRVRGKPLAETVETKCSRITPACAGKTFRGQSRWIRQGDHPRVCGENIAILLSPTTQTGSPPRVRGKLRLIHDELPSDRITPACAGKTFEEVGACAGKKDHPRVCGENHEKGKAEALP